MRCASGRGKHAYASEEDGRIVIAEPPGGVVEHLDTRTGEITDSGRTAANPNGAGHQPPIPKLSIVIGGNGAGKTTWCRQHPHELPEAFYNPDAIAQDLGDWNDAGNQRAAGRIVSTAIRRHLEQREDFGFESTYSGRFAAQDRTHSSVERVRREGSAHWHDRTRDQHRAPASTRQVRHGPRRPAPRDHAAVVSSSEEPCRNGCVDPGHRRARQQPWHDETRREHHEGRHQVTGDANAAVGVGVDPTDRTAPPSHMTRTGE